MKPASRIEQSDLFGPLPPSAAVLREEARFGEQDARTFLPIRNHYSDRIDGERLAAYERAFRAERARQSAEEK